MEFWKSVDNEGKSKDVKVIISDNLLQFNGVRISDFTIGETADMYDLYNIDNSKKLCIVDENGNNKSFRVCIDNNIYLPDLIDHLYFITGGDVQYFNNNSSVIEGIITDEEDKNNGSIVFSMQLKDTVFVDIENNKFGRTVIKINTCNSFTSDIISSLINENK